MRSIEGRSGREALALVAAAFAAAWAPAALAQQRPEGFAVERFYAAAPGGGWFVMDDLRLRGGLGGAVSLTFGYAHRPLRVESADGRQRLSVVSDQAFAEVALAATYDRFRLYLILPGPLDVSGYSGDVGGYHFTAPSANLAQNPDAVADPLLGFDARILGGAASPFRLGAGAQLIIPSGVRADYLTDGSFRAMGRLLLAGEMGRFDYAGHLGVHIRPLDDAPVPGSPRGSELLFGVAGGARLPVGNSELVIGPEVYGETALRSFFGSQTTGLEALLGTRLEGARSDGVGYRVKLGIGGGIIPHFGAPAWRAVLGLELFGRGKETP
jgi:hypothetical protein